MKIFHTAKFAREYRKLADDLKDAAEAAEVIFRENPFDARLKTHKFGGKLKEFWSFSISRKHRIIFEFGEDNAVYFHSVGDHSIYD